MRIDSITLRLRPRGSYEAMDLGVRLVQRNAKVVYLAWCAFVVPFCIAALTLNSIAAWVPSVVLWWFKPLYDRIVLFVLSRAVFGQQVAMRDVTGSWRGIFGNGLIWALTFRRFDMARSFMLPIYLLEGLSGKRRRQRAKVIQKNTRGDAVLLTVAYVHMEIAIELSLLALLFLMLPQHSSLPIWGWLTSEDAPIAFTILTQGLYFLAISVIEPFYVASGFTLYLNRRVELEAWDIELDLKRNLSGLDHQTAAVAAT
jgi:hypothetical protein